MSEEFDVIETLKVADYLRGIDYENDVNYKPSKFALTFVAFIKLVNGVDGESHLTPVMHYKMLDTVLTKSTRIANLCHRGAAKTTLLGEYLILYLAVYEKIPGFGKINLGIYVSDSIENGVKNMRKNLEHRYENSDFLQKVLPKKYRDKNGKMVEGVKFTDVRWEFRNMNGHQLVFKGYGAQTGVRGVKELGIRPQIGLMDDLVSDEDARSATVIAAIEATVYNAVTFALDPKNIVIWSGTPFNANDPLYKAVESGAWEVNVFPICEKFPCSREEFRGSWPDRFTYDYVKQQYDILLALGKISAFNQELMLRIISDEDRLILDDDIRWYNSTLIKRFPTRYNFYITTDFATSEKESADLSVISVWAYNNKGQWFWVDGVCKRQTMDRNINDLFRLVSMYNPLSVGIEVSGQQGGFVSWIEQEMMSRNIFFSLASDKNGGTPGIRPTTNKMQRFNLVVPLFKAGQIYFPEDQQATGPMIECMDELRLITPRGFNSKHDDFIDTISMLMALVAWKPTEESPQLAIHDGLWGAEFNEDIGSPLNSYVV